MLMDFGILMLDAGTVWKDQSPADERAWVLSAGSVHLSWDGGEATVSRPNRFDHDPWCLSVSPGCAVEIRAAENSEICRLATENRNTFAPRLYNPGECFSEYRGEGTMRETSTRIVRTIFDDRNRRESNLVLGEVIGVPGKWSSYPPHHHPQPEIYHYRFLPEGGFGLTAIGDTPCLLRDRDTILIRDGEDHPQVTAPGYAMWYLWVIRHLEGNRYGKPEFTKEHEWVSGPEDRIWQPKKKG
jgi:5-deoxy-glucuronate isomerase